MEEAFAILCKCIEQIPREVTKHNKVCNCAHNITVQPDDVVTLVLQYITAVCDTVARYPSLLRNNRLPAHAYSMAYILTGDAAGTVHSMYLSTVLSSLLRFLSIDKPKLTSVICICRYISSLLTSPVCVLTTTSSCTAWYYV